MLIMTEGTNASVKLDSMATGNCALVSHVTVGIRKKYLKEKNLLGITLIIKNRKILDSSYSRITSRLWL